MAKRYYPILIQLLWSSLLLSGCSAFDASSLVVKREESKVIPAVSTFVKWPGLKIKPLSYDGNELFQEIIEKDNAERKSFRTMIYDNIMLNHLPSGKSLSGNDQYGYAVIELNEGKAIHNPYWTVLTLISATATYFVGIPSGSRTSECTVTLSIFDANQNRIFSSTATGKDTAYSCIFCRNGLFDFTMRIPESVARAFYDGLDQVESDLDAHSGEISKKLICSGPTTFNGYSKFINECNLEADDFYEAEEDHFWTLACRENTINAYQEYYQIFKDLTKYKEHVVEANKRLIDLSFERAVKEDSYEAYTDFLEKYSSHTYAYKYVKTVKQKNEEHAYRKALDYSKEEYQKFLKEHPQYKAAGRSLELNWETAHQKDSIDAYQKFLQEYPQSVHAAEIKAKLEDLCWERAVKEDTEESYNSFIQAYPDSRHRDDAVTYIRDVFRDPFINDAKAGRLESVRQGIRTANADEKARALMMAVWGALHTSIRLEENLKRIVARTSPVKRSEYVEIIRLLMASGADPDRYHYRDFDSVGVKEYLSKMSMKMQLESGRTAFTSYTISGRSEVKLVCSRSDISTLSAKSVAEMEGAEDILALLHRKK